MSALQEQFSTHACPVRGLPAGRLLCSTHWRRVPRVLQSAVYAAWQNGRPSADYLAVRQVVIDAAERGSRT